jgi:polysaccharide export outer membrane protein
MSKKIFFAFILAAAFLSSCVSTKNISYFQDLESKPQEFKSTDYYAHEPVIKPNDNLMITVSSPTLYQEKVAQFNLPIATFLMPDETSTTPTPSTAYQTYCVNKEGKINFPILGEIKLEGMTKSEASEYMKKLISPYINDGVIVNLQFASFNVTVLGEVYKPGPVKIGSDKISILDALGAVGGITVFGDKQNVLLIRDNNGTIEYERFDLTKSDVFNSPHFYLKQNDAIFVEANNDRVREMEYGAEKSYKLQRTSTILSTITSLTSTLVLWLVVNKQ